MELTGVGGGVMLAVAAILWLVYLLPNWLKNREYLATEKNAVRFQQTIRVLAETAEVPTVVRAETLARELAAGRPVGPVAVGRAAVAAPVRRATPAERAARRRRTRAIAATAMLGSIVVAIIQVAMMVTGGIGAGAWVVLLGSALVTVTSFAMLGLLAAMARTSRAPVVRASRRSQPFTDHQFTKTARPEQPWMPVAVPQPLYLSRESVMQAAAVADPHRELQLAAASAERALRSIDQPPSVDAGRFAAMGIVDDSSITTPDLDAVLARRRAAG